MFLCTVQAETLSLSGLPLSGDCIANNIGGQREPHVAKGRHAYSLVENIQVLQAQLHLLQCSLLSVLGKPVLFELSCGNWAVGTKPLGCVCCFAALTNEVNSLWCIRLIHSLQGGQNIGAFTALDLLNPIFYNWDINTFWVKPHGFWHSLVTLKSIGQSDTK